MSTQSLIQHKPGDVVSDRFDPTKSYAKDELCIYGDELWKFTSEKAAGVWDSSKVMSTKIDDEMAVLKNEISSLNASKAEFYYHRHLVDAVMNQAVEIPGAEGYYNVIPVIMGAYSVRDAQVTIVQDSGKWWITSSVSQKYTLFFWEIKSFIG